MSDIQNIRCNVLSEASTKYLIKNTLETLTIILSKSLGPYGSTTIMQDKFSMNHNITKDGFSILNKIKFDNESASTILEFVRKISRNLVKEVGDGSTSAIIVSNSLYNEITTLMENYQIPAKDVIDALKEYEIILTKLVNDLSTPITEENFDKLKLIASIANNNDDKAGDLIYNLYKEVGKDGFITLESSTTEEDKYEIQKGIELPRGYINMVFANQPDKVTYEADNAFVFMCNESLEENDMSMLGNIMGEALKVKKPLVIIAKGFDQEIRNFLHINKHQNKAELDIVAVDYALLSRHHFESFEDLAIYLGATIYDKFDGEVPEPTIEDLGLCAKVIVNETSTRFIEGQGDKAKIKERVEYIEGLIKKANEMDDKLDQTEELFQYRKRIANLDCKVATLYIGGKSEIEKETRKYLMEDAIFACQSALRNGYISGGNLIIPRVIIKNFSSIVGELSQNTSLARTIPEEKKREFFTDFNNHLFNAFANSFRTVLRNKYSDEKSIDVIVDHNIVHDTIHNLKTSQDEDINDTNIINSVRTDIEILKATFSIITLLATSNQFVSVDFQN